MLSVLMIVVFVLGYMAIAFEHPLKIDKAPTALITGMVCWAMYVFVPGIDHHIVEHGANGNGGLYHHLFDIANILFFLLGAMTIVELVDAHEGFAVITDKIKTTSKVKLLWIVGFLTFFFSAGLDNLTSSIVMISLLRKLVADKKTRWLYAGVVILAANAGGAWSPIGDVTTTMLWIKGQLPDVPQMIVSLIIPSLVAMIVPLIILSFMLKGTFERPKANKDKEHQIVPTTQFERVFLLILGALGLISVPVFKTVTHLPPFMGMMLSLGVIWAITEVLHRKKNHETKSQLSVISILKKVDTASVLFFLGILMAVAALQEVGHLDVVASFLQEELGNIYAMNMAIGILSSIVDNVPLVAAAQGMFPFEGPGISADFIAGGPFWEFLAYCAGTGGSCLIIGSAAGVAVMGLEKIDFIWYVKKISLLAVVGYVAGAATYYVMHVI